MSSEVQTPAATETNSGTPEVSFLGKLAQAAEALREQESPEPEAAPVEAAPAEAVAEEPAAEEVKEEAKAEEKEESDPRFAALAKRERDILSRQKELKDAHAALEESRKAADAFEQAKRNASVDPVAFVKSLKLDLPLDQIAKALWYEVLGDDAPAEAKQDKRFTSMEAKVRQLQSELEQHQRAKEERERQDVVREQAMAFQADLRKHVESAEVPEIKLRYGKHADVVLNDLMVIASELGRDGDEEWMNPERVAAALEQRYAEERARYEQLYGPPGPQAKNQPAVGATKNEAAPRTLSNRIANQTAPAAELSEDERFERAQKLLDEARGLR
jgi:hypothetical protein